MNENIKLIVLTIITIICGVYIYFADIPIKAQQLTQVDKQQVYETCVNAYKIRPDVTNRQMWVVEASCLAISGK